MARCTTCGRPLRDAQGALTEALLAAETARGVTGCLGGVSGCKSRQEHEAREMDAYEQKMLVAFARIAAGKQGDDASKSLADFTDAKGNTVTVAQMKADGQARLDALTAKRAAEAAARQVATP